MPPHAEPLWRESWRLLLPQLHMPRDSWRLLLLLLLLMQLLRCELLLQVLLLLLQLLLQVLLLLLPQTTLLLHKMLLLPLPLRCAGVFVLHGVAKAWSDGGLVVFTRRFTCNRGTESR